MNIVFTIIVGWFVLGIIGKLVSDYLFKENEENQQEYDFFIENVPILYKAIVFISTIILDGQLNLLKSIWYLSVRFLINRAYKIVWIILIILYNNIIVRCSNVIVWFYRANKIIKIKNKILKNNPHLTTDEAYLEVKKIFERLNSIRNLKNQKNHEPN